MPGGRSVLGRMALRAIALGALTLGCGDDPTAPRVGALSVTIAGLATGLPGSVTVTGPGDFTRTLGASETLSSLAPGPYTVTASPVSTSDGRWAATPPAQTVTVSAGGTPATAAVAYALATARLALSVTGLPATAAAAVTVTGPDGFDRALTGSAALVLLDPGSYTITAANVRAGELTYRPTPASQTVVLAPSTTPTAVAVAYGVGAGTLAVTISGLPSGAAGVVRVQGPAGFVRDLAASATLPDLEPGAYTVAASPAPDGGIVYSPTPRTQTVQVGAGATALAGVAYAPFALALEPVVSGLDKPVHLAAPAADSRLYIVEQPGRIRVVENGQLRATPFLDISSRVRCCGEQGLLSVAFDPSYATTGFFYVYYTNASGDIVVERYTAAPATAIASTAATPVITIEHRAFTNHNGGLLMFGPDGMLYVGTGDGGGGGDPFGNAQNLGSLLGKLLRIDVRTVPYTVPTTNPFVGQAGRRGEIWAYGLRNPWRYDFDVPSGAGGRVDLYVADVGQNLYEEVNVALSNPAGINYGWNIMEARHCYPAGTSCSDAGLKQPAIEYGHSEGCSVTGGYVYRGAGLPEVAGQYFYSDWCGGWLASMSGDEGGGFTARRWDVPRPGNVLSFGEDAAGELYVLVESGTVRRLVRR